MDRVQLRLHIQNYTRLGRHKTNTIIAYEWLHIGLESLMQKYGVPIVGEIGEIRVKNVIMQDLNHFIEHIKQVAIGRPRSYQENYPIICHHTSKIPPETVVVVEECEI